VSQCCPILYIVEYKTLFILLIWIFNFSSTTIKSSLKKSHLTFSVIVKSSHIKSNFNSNQRTERDLNFYPLSISSLKGVETCSSGSYQLFSKHGKKSNTRTWSIHFNSFLLVNKQVIIGNYLIYNFTKSCLYIHHLYTRKMFL